MRKGEELLLPPKRPINLGEEASQAAEAAEALPPPAEEKKGGGEGATTAAAASEGEEEAEEAGLKCLKCEKTMLDIYSYVSHSFLCIFITCFYLPYFEFWAFDCCVSF